MLAHAWVGEPPAITNDSLWATYLLWGSPLEEWWKPHEHSNVVLFSILSMFYVVFATYLTIGYHWQRVCRRNSDIVKNVKP